MLFHCKLGEEGRADSLGKKQCNGIQSIAFFFFFFWHRYRNISREMIQHKYTFNCPQIKNTESSNSNQRGVNQHSPVLTAMVTTVRSAKAVMTTFCKMFSCQKINRVWIFSGLLSVAKVFCSQEQCFNMPNLFWEFSLLSSAEGLTESSAQQGAQAGFCSVFKRQRKLGWSTRNDW